MIILNLLSQNNLHYGLYFAKFILDKIINSKVFKNI